MHPSGSIGQMARKPLRYWKKHISMYLLPNTKSQQYTANMIVQITLLGSVSMSNARIRLHISRQLFGAPKIL
jgi:hypothetical protein